MEFPTTFIRSEKKIKKWYTFLIHSPLDVETKKNACHHDDCLYHKPTKFVWQTGLQHDDCAEVLYYILLERVADFDEVTYGGTTQQNESFHKEQLSYGGKDILFPRSQIMRDYLAL